MLIVGKNKHKCINVSSIDVVGCCVQQFWKRASKKGDELKGLWPKGERQEFTFTDYQEPLVGASQET